MQFAVIMSDEPDGKVSLSLAGLRGDDVNSGESLAARLTMQLYESAQAYLRNKNLLSSTNSLDQDESCPESAT